MPLSKLVEMGSNEALAFLICRAFFLAFFSLLFFLFFFFNVFNSAGSGRLFSGVVIDTK